MSTAVALTSIHSDDVTLSRVPWAQIAPLDPTGAGEASLGKSTDGVCFVERYHDPHVVVVHCEVSGSCGGHLGLPEHEPSSDHTEVLAVAVVLEREGVVVIGRWEVPEEHEVEAVLQAGYTEATLDRPVGIPNALSDERRYFGMKMTLLVTA